MAGLLSNLIDSLTEQKQYYTELTLISEEKRKVIINNDLDNLSDFTTVENVLISKNEKLEKRLEEIMKDVGIVLNIKPDELTVSKIASVINNEKDKEDLLSLTRDLSELAVVLKKHNNANKELLDNAIEYIQFSMNVLTNADAKDDARNILKQAKKGKINHKK
ncbi:MAG: flagellar protein FlgN [Lachnospirales bacterium]